MAHSRMTRGRAAAIHLALSALIATAVFAVIFFVWYPGPLFGAAGGRDLFLLIACVDVTIGPLITFIIFVPGKRGLVFDLWVIAILQAAALSYGTWVLYESRPAWIAFVYDRFEIVRANMILEPEREKAKPPFNEKPITGPRLIGTRRPTDPNDQLRIGTTALQGFDLQSYPQYYVEYDKVRDEVRARHKPLSKLRELNPEAKAAIDALPAKYGRDAAVLAYFPMRAGSKDLTAIVDSKTGDYLGIEQLQPWGY